MPAPTPAQHSPRAESEFSYVERLCAESAVGSSVTMGGRDGVWSRHIKRSNSCEQESGDCDRARRGNERLAAGAGRQPALGGCETDGRREQETHPQSGGGGAAV